MTARLETLCGILMRETELAGVEKQVQGRIKKQIEKNQKDYYLREQIQAPFRTELGENDATESGGAAREAAQDFRLPDEARQKAEQELDRLARMAPGTPEIGVAANIYRVDPRSALGQVYHRQPGSQACAPCAG